MTRPGGESYPAVDILESDNPIRLASNRIVTAQNGLAASLTCGDVSHHDRRQSAETRLAR